MPSDQRFEVSRESGKALSHNKNMSLLCLKKQMIESETIQPISQFTPSFKEMKHINSNLTKKKNNYRRQTTISKPEISISIGDYYQI